MDTHTLTISVAQLPLGISFKQKDLFEQVKKAYQRFLSNEDYDLWLKVEKTAARNLKESFGPGLYLPNIFASQEKAAFSGGLELKIKEGRVLVAKENSRELFSNFIRGLYCYLIYQEGGILLHATVIVRKNKAWLFFGPSGSGKTTIASLSKDFTILSDDLAIIKNIGSNFYAFAVPWSLSNLKDNTAASFSVAAIFNLIKDNNVYLEKLKTPLALSCVFTYLTGLEQDPQTYSQLLSRYTKLTQNVPCYNLHFTKDSSFWQEIDKLPIGAS